MKKGAKPELVAGWWRVNLPKGLGRAKDLNDAFKGYQTAVDRLKESGSPDDCSACLKSIDELAEAAKKLRAEAQEALKAAAKQAAPDPAGYGNTVEALDKLPAMLREAREDAEDLQRDEDGLFVDPEKYQPYLQKWLKKAKTKPLAFAFVAGETSAEHRIALHGSRDPARLLAMLKQETSLKKGTFGTAGAHVGQDRTLVLDLQTKPLPGLPKKFRLLFKRFKPLPFDSVLVTVGGSPAADLPDPEDTEPEEIERVAQSAAVEADIPPAPPNEKLIAVELMSSFKGLASALNKVMAADPQAKDEILGIVERFKTEHAQSRLDAATATLEQLRTLLKPVPPPAAPLSPRGDGEGKVAYGRARLAWLQARSVVRSELDRLAQAIIEDTRGRPDAAKIEAGCGNLYDMLDELDERLADELDAALIARSEEERLRLHARARTTLDEYRDYLDTDELVMAIDGNAFAPVKVRQTMAAALSAIGRTLA